jgi:hemolysin III
MLADGVIHVSGVGLGVAAVAALVVAAVQVAGPWEVTSVLVYGSGLLSVLFVSALYNLWPLTPRKWLLRRFDHSAIYLLIAGTYTPFLTQMKGGFQSTTWLVGIWATALFGMVLKLAFPGRFDRLSIVLYLLIGWSGIVVYDAVVATLPATTLWLLAAGGLLYTTGVIFHLWQGLRFQNAIWHAFVLVAAGCHYGAVLDCIVLAKV